jgi:hypothetical protein
LNLNNAPSNVNVNVGGRCGLSLAQARAQTGFYEVQLLR